MSTFAFTLVEWRPYESGETIAVTTGDSEATDLPASNLKDPRRFLRGRNTNGAGTISGFQVVASLDLSCIGLLNIAPDTTEDSSSMDWLFYTDSSFTAPITASDEYNVPVFSDDALIFNNANIPRKGDMDVYFIEDLEVGITDLKDITGVESIRVRFYVNTGIGYHQCSHIALGVNAWQPKPHADIVHDTSSQDLGVLDGEPIQSAVFDGRGNVFWTSKISLANMTGDTSAAVMDWLLCRGIGRSAIPFFCFPKPTRTQTAGQQVLYARSPQDRGGLVRLTKIPLRQEYSVGGGDAWRLSFEVMQWNEVALV